MESLKDKIINILNNNIGKNISGEEIAKKLGVTRNGVWKVINNLKKEGFDIKSNPNLGYILNSRVDVFTNNSINAHLKAPCKILIYEKADSSNRIGVLAQRAQRAYRNNAHKFIIKFVININLGKITG